MSRRRYAAWNGTTGVLGNAELGFTTLPTTLTTGATQVQICPGSNISVIEWGYQLATIPTAIVNIDLLTTTTGATVHAYSSYDVINYDDAAAAATAATLGTATSGYVSTTETAPSSDRYLDQGPGWSQFYCKQFPLDREPGCLSGSFLKLRGWSATPIGIRGYIVWEE